LNGREEQVTTGESERKQMTRKHIFAINSSPEFLDFLRTLLQESRYNVTTTNFVPETFAQIAAVQPDLLIIDLVAGQHAGWDLLEQLGRVAVTEQIPVMVTATDPALLARARAAQAQYGAETYLAKPMDIDDLLGAIRRLIGPA
jgi:DNA-binding response OmpR family regulator